MKPSLSRSGPTTRITFGPAGKDPDVRACDRQDARNLVARDFRNIVRRNCGSLRAFLQRRDDSQGHRHSEVRPNECFFRFMPIDRLARDLCTSDLKKFIAIAAAKLVYRAAKFSRSLFATNHAVLRPRHLSYMQGRRSPHC